MLHRANYIEQAGTGISRIKKAVVNHKKKLELDIEYSDDSIFYSIIFKKKRLAETAQKIESSDDKSNFQGIFSVNPKEFQGIFSVNPKEFQSIFGINALNTVWLIYKKPNITAKEIAEKLSITERSARNYLSQLKQKRIIERVGSDKTGYWKVIKK